MDNDLIEAIEELAADVLHDGYAPDLFTARLVAAHLLSEANMAPVELAQEWDAGRFTLVRRVPGVALAA